MRIHNLYIAIPGARVSDEPAGPVTGVDELLDKPEAVLVGARTRERSGAGEENPQGYR